MEQHGRDLRERLNTRRRQANPDESERNGRHRNTRVPPNEHQRDCVRERSPLGRDSDWVGPWHQKRTRPGTNDQSARRRATSIREPTSDRENGGGNPARGERTRHRGAIDTATEPEICSRQQNKIRHDESGVGCERRASRRPGTGADAGSDQENRDGPPLKDGGDGGPEKVERSGRRRQRHTSQTSWPRERCDSDASTQTTSSSKSKRTPWVKETDPAILARRQKQLEYGYNTLCYQEYIKAVPKNRREPFHPRSPQRLRKASRRSWDWAVKMWRIQLHYWNDPVKLAELRNSSMSDTASVRTDASSPEPKQDAAGIERDLQRAEAFLQAATSRLRSDPAAEQDLVDTEDSKCAVKQELDVSMKQEPGLEAPDDKTVGLADHSVEPAVKTEPLDWPLAVKREPVDAEDAQSMEEQPETSLYLAERAGEDQVLDWADDLEGLASELAV